MKFLTNLTLWKKITLLTAIGLLLGVGVFSSLGMHAVGQATEAMLQERMTTAQMVADYLDEALGRALNELGKTAVALASKPGDDPGPLLRALEDMYTRLSIQTRGIYLLDETGKVTWSTDVKLNVIDISAYPGITKAISSNQPTVSGLVSLPGDSSFSAQVTPVILLSSPVSSLEPSRTRALVIAIDPAQSSIGGFIQPMKLGQTGYVEIVDQNGIVITRTTPGPKLAPFERSDHSGRFAALIAAGEPSRGVCHTCHEPEQQVERKDVLAFVPLSQAEWGVVIRQSETEALAPARELRQSLLMFGAGLVTVALIFVLVTTHDVGSRIKMLTNASQKIAEGDLVSPVITSGRDEVGILAQTLDTMRGKLKDSYTALQQKTNELSSMLSVSEIVTSTFDLGLLLDSVVAKAVTVISGADYGLLLLQNADEESVTVQCAINLGEDTVPQQASEPDGTATDTPLPAAGSTINGNIYALLHSSTLQARVRSSIRAEVSYQKRYIGSLIIGSAEGTQAFSPSDHSLLQAIADYIAIAIERAQLTKEAENARALHEADRLRSQFISSVSHELRTPLTLIKGYSTALLRDDFSWDEHSQKEFLQVIDEKTDELRDLIDKILQSAKLEAGAVKLEKEPVLIPHVVHKIIEELTPRARKCTFTVDFAPSFPVVEADVRCIEQIVRNLMENAVKYSPEGGEVTVAGKAEDSRVVVSISDRGIGIPAEHLGRIFERFYRVDSAQTHGIPGSGLGLFITKGHVEAHGGEIWVKSEPGLGSTFYFSLPFSQCDEEP